MINFAYKDSYEFDDLVKLMAILRAECPWDREQTHASIRQNLLEEAYEVCEGIDTDDPAILREELGDLLLQILFHAKIEEERGRFTLGEVFTELEEKLIPVMQELRSLGMTEDEWQNLWKGEEN